MKFYLDFNDWWVGYSRGETHHYVCPLPTLVTRWDRRVRGVSYGDERECVEDSPLRFGCWTCGAKPRKTCVSVAGEAVDGIGYHDIRLLDARMRWR